MRIVLMCTNYVENSERVIQVAGEIHRQCADVDVGRDRGQRVQRRVVVQRNLLLLRLILKQPQAVEDRGCKCALSLRGNRGDASLDLAGQILTENVVRDQSKL